MLRSQSEPEVQGFELVCVTSCQSACLLQTTYWSIHEKSWSFTLSFLNDKSTSLRKRVSRQIITGSAPAEEEALTPQVAKTPDAMHLPFPAVWSVPVGLGILNQASLEPEKMGMEPVCPPCR